MAMLNSRINESQDSRIELSTVYRDDLSGENNVSLNALFSSGYRVAYIATQQLSQASEFEPSLSKINSSLQRAGSICGNN